MLRRQSRLAETGAIAGLHHERMDGSGYPRGLTGDAILLAARLVTAADAYHALAEDRPHRPALDADERRTVLREVRADRFDAGSVQAATGRRAPARAGPATTTRSPKA